MLSDGRVSIARKTNDHFSCQKFQKVSFLLPFDDEVKSIDIVLVRRNDILWLFVCSVHNILYNRTIASRLTIFYWLLCYQPIWWPVVRLFRPNSNSPFRVRQSRLLVLKMWYNYCNIMVFFFSFSFLEQGIDKTFWIVMFFVFDFSNG